MSFGSVKVRRVNPAQPAEKTASFVGRVTRLEGEAIFRSFGVAGLRVLKSIARSLPDDVRCEYATTGRGVHTMWVWRNDVVPRRAGWFDFGMADDPGVRVVLDANGEVLDVVDVLHPTTS